jgi:hypothetical protein
MVPWHGQPCALQNPMLHYLTHWTYTSLFLQGITYSNGLQVYHTLTSVPLIILTALWQFFKSSFCDLIGDLLITEGSTENIFLLRWQWIMLFHEKLYLAFHFLVVESVALLVLQPFAFFSWLLVKSPPCYLAH